MYNDFAERTRLEAKMAEQLADCDLASHLEQLEAHDIKGNDFYPIQPKDVQQDFVNDLLFRYLQELKHRMKAAAFGQASTAALLRKGIKLTDMDEVVKDCQAKCADLLTSADKLAENLRAKQRQEDIERNIKKLTQRKLEVDPYKMRKRRRSWKGTAEPLLSGFALEEWDEAVRGTGQGRANSRKYRRARLNCKFHKDPHELQDESAQGDSDSADDVGGKRGGLQSQASFKGLGQMLGGFGLSFKQGG